MNCPPPFHEKQAERRRVLCFFLFFAFINPNARRRSNALEPCCYMGSRCNNAAGGIKVTGGLSQAQRVLKTNGSEVTRWADVRDRSCRKGSQSCQDWRSVEKTRRRGMALASAHSVGIFSFSVFKVAAHFICSGKFQLVVMHRSPA